MTAALGDHAICLELLGVAGLNRSPLRPERAAPLGSSLPSELAERAGWSFRLVAGGALLYSLLYGPAVTPACNAEHPPRLGMPNLRDRLSLSGCYVPLRTGGMGP
jgi:hypothetical protein